MFYFRQFFDIVIILVYVDDIIITGNHSDLLSSLILRLSSTFLLKDLGCLSYFLGAQTSFTTLLHLLFITSSKYV